MIEKLRSHLRKAKGFTLIELLVVIAIIAILVVIVIVAINPIQRLADAADRRGAANVRSTGTLVQTCITQLSPTLTAAALYTTAAGGCGNATTLGTFGTPGAAPLVIDASAVAATDICVSQGGATSGANPHWYNYRASTTATPTCVAPAVCVAVSAGTVTEEPGALPATAATRCP